MPKQESLIRYSNYAISKVEPLLVVKLVKVVKPCYWQWHKQCRFKLQHSKCTAIFFNFFLLRFELQMNYVVQWLNFVGLLLVEIPKGHLVTSSPPPQVTKLLAS